MFKLIGFFLFNEMYSMFYLVFYTAIVLNVRIKILLYHMARYAGTNAFTGELATGNPTPWGPCDQVNNMGLLMGGSKGGSRWSGPAFLAHIIGFLTLGPKLDPPPHFWLVDLRMRWTPAFKKSWIWPPVEFGILITVEPRY